MLLSSAKFVRSATKKFGTHVIQNRAVADFRDGLKPVQRRVLYAMFKDNLIKQYSKCAGVVGETMKSYHPHSDQSIYGTIVTMVNDRYPLISGYGNFGTLMDSPASFRYTECRLSELHTALFDCIETAEFHPNYSDKLLEPLFLPSRLPFLLLNGSEGIAVGLVAHIPPHNLTELLDAVRLVIKHRNKGGYEQAVECVKGPDYGYGTLTSSPEDIKTLYEDGACRLHYRCNYHYEDIDGVHQLVITSVAPRFNLPRFFEKCQKLREANLIGHVADESSGDDVRITVSFDNEAVVEDRIIPLLHTSLKYFFYCTKRKKEDDIDLMFLPLADFLREWITFYKKTETQLLRKKIADNEQKISREHAKYAAIGSITKLAKILETGKKPLEAPVAKLLNIDEEQAKFVLDCPLRSLAKLNKDGQKNIIQDLKKTVLGLQTDLDNIWEFMDKRISEFYQYAKPRGTTLNQKAPKLKMETTETWVVVNPKGIVKRLQEFKGTGRPWSFIANGTLGFSIIDRNSRVHKWPFAFGFDGDSKVRNVVGLVGHNKSLLVVKASNGRVSVTRHPSGNSGVCALQLADKQFATQAVGVSKGDELFVFNATRTKLLVYSYDDLKKEVTKKNTVGFNIIPKTKDVRMFVVPKGCRAYDFHGYHVKNIEEMLGNDHILLVGERNLCWINGARQVLTQKEVQQALIEKKIQQLQILD